MKEKNDMVLRISEHPIGTVEWILPESVQKMFRDADARLAAQPEETRALLRLGFDEVINTYTNHLRAFLYLLTGIMFLPPEAMITADAILRNTMSGAASDIQQLLHDQKIETMH